MAAQDYANVVQQLYVSYFGRPADYYGLQNFEQQLDAIGAPTTFVGVQAAVQADTAGTSALSKLVNSFNSSAESAALYGTDNSQVGIGKFVNAIYQNVLGRDADKGGFDYWVAQITSGTVTKANAAAAITQGALDNKTPQGLLDAQAVTNKLNVAIAFTTALDTPVEITSYSGDQAAAAARSLLSGVNSGTNVTAYQTTVEQTIAGLGNVVNGSTIAVTTNVDNLVGTNGNDVFNALDVDTAGAGASTLTAFDTIDGGAGKDTLNIYTDGKLNSSLGTNSSIKNVETINILNTGSAGVTGLTDASKYVGVTALWQTGVAGDVTNVSSATTVGFHGLTVANGNVDIAPVDSAASTSIALDNAEEGVSLSVTASATGKLAGVVLAGSVADTNADGTVANTDLAVTVGKDVQTLTVNSSVATNLSISNGAGTKVLTTIDASASTGAITYADSETTVANITTGSGDDTVTVVTVTAKDVSSTTADETVNAVVNTGAGKDTINVDVTGDGAVTVNAGAGNDTVNIVGRGTAALTINLGDGNDVFTSGVAIGANDKIDAGAGSDTLSLNLVGSANVGAFSNFDAFDAAGLGHGLDLDILSQKNNVTEIVATADVGSGAALLNVGAGVGFRITGNAGTGNPLEIMQKTAGDLTVTLDIDESGDAATTTAADVSGAVSTNATSVKAVFDSSFVDAAKNTTGDNTTDLLVNAGAAKTVAVVSGGDNAMNHITIGGADASAELTTVTVTGAQHLSLDLGSAAAKLATIDSSAATGGLTASLADVIGGGSIKLGSGADIITITNASTVGGVESITGFEKTAAVAVSTATGDATAKAAAIADADVLSFTGQVVADGGNVAKGVLSFTGSGPSSLAAAATLADAAAATTGDAVVFEYLGNSYVFVQGGGTDTLVQLAGVTGIKNFAEDGSTDHFFIV